MFRLIALSLLALAALSAAGVKGKLKTTVGIDPKSGRLVRSTTVVLPRSVPARVLEPKVIEARAVGGPEPVAKRVPVVVAPEKLRKIVEAKAREHGVDPLLVDSVIQVESAYNPYAISPVGAQGLMQLMPGTARTYGVKDWRDPEQNIDGGVRYLKYLKTLFDDERLVLAAYNAGEGAVHKYGWIPPYNETQNYVYEVGRRYGQARRDHLKAAPVKAAAPVGAEQPKPIEEFVDADGRIHLVLKED
jgi:Transglycosylase SLT domain